MASLWANRHLSGSARLLSHLIGIAIVLFCTGCHPIDTPALRRAATSAKSESAAESNKENPSIEVTTEEPFHFEGNPDVVANASTSAVPTEPARFTEAESNVSVAEGENNSATDGGGNSKGPEHQRGTAKGGHPVKGTADSVAELYSRAKKEAQSGSPGSAFATAATAWSKLQEMAAGPEREQLEAQLKEDLEKWAKQSQANQRGSISSGATLILEGE